jgi:hypothetical protein
MGGCRHPFAGSSEPQPDGPPVTLTAVTLFTFGLRTYFFDTPFTTPPSIIDPAFEISVNGITWSGPDTFVGFGPQQVSFQYPLPFWGGNQFRILTHPTTMSWAPSALTVPIAGPIPFP